MTKLRDWADTLYPGVVFEDAPPVSLPVRPSFLKNGRRVLVPRVMGRAESVVIEIAVQGEARVSEVSVTGALTQETARLLVRTFALFIKDATAKEADDAVATILKRLTKVAPQNSARYTVFFKGVSILVLLTRPVNLLTVTIQKDVRG